MAKQKRGKQTKVAKSKILSTSTPTRKLKQPKYSSFRLGKRIKPVKTNIPSSFKILKQSLGLLKQHWKLFVGIAVIYGLLSIILVRGFGGGTNLSEIKTTLQNGIGGQPGSLATAATLFTYLLGSAGSSTSQSGGVYQTLLIIVISLVTIWALRQVLAGNSVRIRDAFYKGTYPLVQFTLVLLVVGLQLIPLLVGSWLYSTVVGNGIASAPVEKLVWAALFFLLALLSLYMVASSLFALYIVTLPDMTPMKALRSARELVRYRRWMVLRKVIFLPIALLILGAIIMIPLILIVTPLAEWIFFLLSMFVLVVVNSYMYTLYRALL